jgi:hypothetical protein
MTLRRPTRHQVSWMAVAAVALLLPRGAGAEPAPALPRQDFPAPVLGSLRAVLDAYEEVRGQLAADRVQLLPAGAARLAGTLDVALADAGGLSAEVASVVEEAAVIAESLGDAEDLAAAREAFGEVSRRLLLLGDADPRLLAGWYVFSCPMATTFDRWLQPTNALENPYMGTAMLQCGWLVEEGAAPARAAAPEAETAAGEPGADEPELEPGIPGLKMVDVRDHKFLWREIDQLQIWESRDQITAAEFRSKTIEKTAHFLGLSGGDADRFAAAAAAAVANIREAFRQMRQGDAADYAAAQERFPAEVEAAVAGFGALLGDEPRHVLFAPGGKEWLLRLAFGPGAAKEAREAQAQTEGGRR